MIGAVLLALIEILCHIIIYIYIFKMAYDDPSFFTGDSSQAKEMFQI